MRLLGASLDPPVLQGSLFSGASMVRLLHSGLLGESSYLGVIVELVSQSVLAYSFGHGVFTHPLH